MEINLSWASHRVAAHLESSAAADQLVGALPATLWANRWGDLVYFPLPLGIVTGESDPVVVEPGTVCYWHEAKSLVIAFGHTPLSQDGECRLPTPMAVLGRVQGSLAMVYTIGTTDKVEIRVKE